MNAVLLAAGGFVLGPPVTNSELTQFPADRLPLIAQKTGIEMRHYALPEQSTSDLAYEAVLRCLDQVNFPANRLDAIVLATSTPDRLIPETAPGLQQMLGAPNAFVFDLNSICRGSVCAQCRPIERGRYDVVGARWRGNLPYIAVVGRVATNGELTT